MTYLMSLINVFSSTFFCLFSLCFTSVCLIALAKSRSTRGAPRHPGQLKGGWRAAEAQLPDF